MALLLIIAATSIIGTVIPQNENPGYYLRVFGELFFRVFSFLDLFDMYHSWWFQFLLIMLLTNIIVCSIDRLSATWKILFVKNPSFNVSVFRKQKNREKFTDKRDPEQLRQLYEPVVSKQFGFSKTENSKEGIIIFAEKWRWSRVGVYIVHFSIVLLLMGGILGSFFGFEGMVNIPEGESSDSIRLKNSEKIIKLGFQIKCEDFDISFYKNGMPKEYRSTLTIIEENKPVLKKDIIVNHPLRYKGINIFQSHYGELAAEHEHEKNSKTFDPKGEITLVFKSQETGMMYELGAEMGKPLDIPEGNGKFVIVEFEKSAKFMGQNIGEAFIGILTPVKGDPQNVTLPIHFPNFDKMRKGKIVISVAHQKHENFHPEKKTEKQYYTGLQVNRDPGVWIVYLGFVVMIVGCIITFFMPHQRLCIEINKGKKNSRIFVAGTSFKNTPGMENRVKKIAKTLAHIE